MKARGYTEEQIDEYVNMETAYRDAKAALDEKNKADREAIALSNARPQKPPARRNRKRRKHNARPNS